MSSSLEFFSCVIIYSLPLSPPTSSVCSLSRSHTSKIYLRLSLLLLHSLYFSLFLYFVLVKSSSCLLYEFLPYNFPPFPSFLFLKLFIFLILVYLCIMISERFCEIPITRTNSAKCHALWVLWQNELNSSLLVPWNLIRVCSRFYVLLLLLSLSSINYYK